MKQYCVLVLGDCIKSTIITIPHFYAITCQKSVSTAGVELMFPIAFELHSLSLSETLPLIYS